MKLSEVLSSGSQYLKAVDLPERSEIDLVISNVQVEEIEDGSGGREKKPVVFFVGKEKGMVVNKTNGEMLIAAYGDDTESLAGKPIVLYRTETQFQGKLGPCLRLRVPAKVDGPEPQDIPF